MRINKVLAKGHGCVPLVDKADKEYESGMERNLTGVEEISSGKELKEYALRSLEFTINNEMAVKMRRLFIIEQYRNEMFAESATRHQVTHMVAMYSDVFKKLMDKGIMIKGDADIIALEFIAPVTLMIQMSDREPDKKAEALARSKKHFDIFVERYCKK